MLDNEIRWSVVGKGFGERGFDLVGDGEVMEDREVGGVGVEDGGRVGGNEW